MAKNLTDQQLAEALAGLPGWTVQQGKLHCDYHFPDFIHAFGFMATAATYIQAKDHHPEWSNVWNRVTIDLITHHTGGITEKDVDLASFLEKTAKRLL